MGNAGDELTDARHLLGLEETLLEEALLRVVAHDGYRLGAGHEDGDGDVAQLRRLEDDLAELRPVRTPRRREDRLQGSRQGLARGAREAREHGGTELVQGPGAAAGVDAEETDADRLEDAGEIGRLVRRRRRPRVGLRNVWAEWVSGERQYCLPDVFGWESRSRLARLNLSIAVSRRLRA